MSFGTRIRAQVSGSSIPPVERWHPPLSGEMDLEIRRDGTWLHEGRPILRPELVCLFASILRRDSDGHHYLVTPLEKWRIRVEDAPLHAVRLDALQRDGMQVLRFTTLTGDEVEADAAHPIRVDQVPLTGEPRPYVRVRHDLWALIGRAVFLELAELAELATDQGREVLGVRSAGLLFVLGEV